MAQAFSNIVLIGMPGAGKSTVGIILAKYISFNFVDTDVLIQIQEKRTLQEIIDSEGHNVLRQIEENVLKTLSVKNFVISTGGSAVYSEAAMNFLKSTSIIIFLDMSFSLLKSRIHNFSTRGIAKKPEQSFEDLFNERYILYKKYSDVTINCDDLNQEEVCAKIISELGKYSIRD